MDPLYVAMLMRLREKLRLASFSSPLLLWTSPHWKKNLRTESVAPYLVFLLARPKVHITALRLDRYKP